MIGARSRLLGVAGVVAALFSAVPARGAGRARADTGVTIHYESEDQLELARRVASELASEGYTVEISALAEPSPCDLDGPKLVSVPRNTKAWIRLAADASNPDAIVASVCYLGAQPFLQQAAPSAPRGEPNQLALATAEALNGLRSKLPPLESEPERAAPRKESPVGERKPAPHVISPPERFVNSAVLGAAVVWTLPDFPPLPGISARATLGVGPSVGLAIDAFIPTRGGELASDVVTATVRTAWLRVGPRFAGGLGDFELSGAALAGPALTWATAVASPPRTGTADLTTGAVLTLAASVEYPRRATIFACASASASALLPGARLDLGDDAAVPLGSWPIDASIGVGARWGSP